MVATVTPMIRPLLLTAALLATTAPARASLTPAETRMRTATEAEATHDAALLERLVMQNSGTLNLPGVTKVGEMMRTELTALGFAVRWADMRATGRAGHLIATHKGNGRGKRVLMIGHLDTVFEPDSRFTGFRRDGDRAIGPGVGDDKGGLTVIIAALRAMQAAGTLKNADIMVVLTGDEERTGKPLSTSRADLVAAGKWADVALEYEGLAVTPQGDAGTIARRGATDWELETTGVPGHSGGVFGADLGYGANYELARILDTFRRDLPEANLTYNVGVMAGGTPPRALPRRRRARPISSRSARWRAATCGR